MRTLVLRGGAVGDFILTLPAIARLRARCRGGMLELVSYPRVRRFVLECGLVGGFRSLDGALFSSLYIADAPVREGLVDYVGSFDCVVSFLPDPEGIVRRNLGVCGVGEVIMISPMPAPGLHAADHYAAGVDGRCRSGEEIPRVPLPASVLAVGSRLAASFGERIMAVHPGSGSPAKNWPPDRFVAVCRQARERHGLSPVMTFGEADGALARVLSELAPEIPRLAGKDLLTIAGFLSACTCYLGNDSGISHLAAAAGARTLALFGPTDPAVWGPRGSTVSVLKTGGAVADLSVDRVMAEFDSV